jgi:drug/metabolite transporter (DMT)-like permease
VDLALGLVCGLVGALCYGLSDVGATVASRRTSSLIAAAGMQVTMLAAYILVAIATGTSLPDDPAVLTQVAFFGCLVGLAFLLSYEAFRIGPLAVVGPVLSLIGALTAVLAVLLLGEQLRPLQGVGVVTATGGLILMAVVPDRGLGRSRLVSRGVVFALVSIVVWATITIGITGPIRQVGALPVMVGSRMASTATLWSILALVWGRALVRRRAADRGAGNPAGLPVNPTHRPGGGPTFPRDRAAIIGLIALMGVLDAVGFAAVAYGLERSAAWLVALISSLGPSVTLIFGIFVLGERLRRTQWAGLVLVFASLVLISLP